MTLIMSTITYYLKCDACQHRFESQYRNEKCPLCHASTTIYGLKDVSRKKEKAPGSDQEPSRRDGD